MAISKLDFSADSLMGYYKSAEVSTQNLLGKHSRKIPFNEIESAVRALIPIFGPAAEKLLSAIKAVDRVIPLQKLSKIVSIIPFGFIKIVCSSIRKGLNEGPVEGILYFCKEFLAYAIGNTAGDITGSLVGVVFAAIFAGPAAAAGPLGLAVLSVATWLVKKGVSLAVSYGISCVTRKIYKQICDSESA